MAMTGAALGGNANFPRTVDVAPITPTISGAVGKIDGVGNRLSELVKALESITDTIGGPRAVGDTSKVGQVQASGVVHRLHDSADYAHTKLGEVEGLVQSIQRLLG